MSKPTIFIVTATAFVCGFGIDLLIKPSWLDDGKQAASGKQGSSLSERSARPPTSAQKSEVLLREMMDSDFEEQMARLDELGPGDYPALVKAFLSKS